MSFAQQERVLAGHYRVRAQVGYATLGWLYHAVDERTAREVAFRIVLGVRDPEATRQRLSKLIQQLSTVHHPALAGVYDCGLYEGQLWFASEWLTGRSIDAAANARGGTIPVADAARVGLKVADALGAAHHAGVVHRGLSTRNIFDSGGHIKVLESGVSGSIYADAPILANTPGATPPEQIMNGVVDHRGDVYALGCCLFTLVVGRSPFDGGNRAEIMAAQGGWRAPRARDVNASIPESVELTLLRAMATRPEDRFQSMSEFAAALSKWPGAVE